jgi:manganese/zinc/iron transport system substrate-binding protein
MRISLLFRLDSVLVCALFIAIAGCNRFSSMSAASGNPSGTPPQSCHDDPDSASAAGATPTPPIRLSLVGPTYQGRYPINVVCTTGLVADLVHTVGGQYVAPQQLIRAEVDPHLYRVSAGDMSALNRANMIFYSGLRLEAKMIDLLAQFSGKKPTFAVTQYLDGSKLLNSADGAADPHVWFDVMLWRSAVDVVRDALAIYDPAHAEEYRSRAADYDQQLQRLNSDMERQLAGIPSERKQLVTAHDAFRYFGRAYQFEVRGVAGISTANAAGLGDLDALIGFIADQKIKAVFTESGVPDRALLALIEGCRANNQTVVIAGQLYSDSLGPPNTPEDSYVGMIEQNNNIIVQALK